MRGPQHMSISTKRETLEIPKDKLSSWTPFDLLGTICLFLLQTSLQIEFRASLSGPLVAAVAVVWYGSLFWGCGDIGDSDLKTG